MEETMKELQKPESSCREDDSQAGDDGDEKEEKDMGDDFDQEEMIKNTKQVLEKHLSRRDEAPMKRFSEDDGSQLTELNLSQLRYSQLSCKETFVCGRPISELVQDLLFGRVNLSAQFLRLTVFQIEDEWTDEIIYRCIDNRRLYALKQYAKRSGKKNLKVNVKLFSHKAVMQFQRFILNSDDTNGYDVRLRENRSKGKNNLRQRGLQRGRHRNPRNQKRKKHSD